MGESWTFPGAEASQGGWDLLSRGRRNGCQILEIFGTHGVTLAEVNIKHDFRDSARK
jgi:hypothetical protein